MIKQFLEKGKELSNDALFAILTHIDKTMETHNDRLDKIEGRLDENEDNFNNTRAQLDSDANTRKIIKKIFLGLGLPIAVAVILKFLGI